MTIYLIRHAQSQFNAAFRPDLPDPMIFDAPITDLGRQQAQGARQKLENLKIEKVIVSPFTRTLQTADIIFGNTRPMEIHAAVREQVSNSCDVGRTPKVLAVEFPHYDFAKLEEHWWHKGELDHRGIPVEPDEVLYQRAGEFAGFLKSNNIHSTAIVSHGNFIRALSGQQPDNCEIIEYIPA